MGSDWYKGMGTEQSPGVKIVCMSGHVEKPGNYEVELGVTYRQLIEMAGGMKDGKKFKALLPSGGSGPVIVESALDAPLTYEGLTPHGSVMGSASVIVMDESTDMVWAALKMLHFFKHESCGKCTPCREGTFWMEKLLHRIYEGHGTMQDVETLNSVANQIGGRTLCALGDFAINPVLSTIKHFPQEYKAKVTASANGHVIHLKNGRATEDYDSVFTLRFSELKIENRLIEEFALLSFVRKVARQEKSVKIDDFSENSRLETNR